MQSKENEITSFSKAQGKADILDDPSGLCSLIQSVLQEQAIRERIFPPGADKGPESSAVLFPLCLFKKEEKDPPQASLILNKRSPMVKQAGDLCLPGGGISPGIDTLISKLITLPIMPLGRWPLWPELFKKRPNQASRLSMLLATGIREGLEEMGMNPFRLRFLGPLPAQDLVMYRRTIYPLATWVEGQRRFRPNWEVEKVVFIPLKDLLRQDLYRRCRMMVRGGTMDFPCFLHSDEGGDDIIWGATYRIVVSFMALVFGFTPPPAGDLPLLENQISRPYLDAEPSK